MFPTYLQGTIISDVLQQKYNLWKNIGDDSKKLQ